MPDNLSTDKTRNVDSDYHSEPEIRDDPNHVKITVDGGEGTYHKGGLILAIVIIFLLGFLAGALIF